MKTLLEKHWHHLLQEEVLNQVDCSVLTLKPEGFVTPATLE